MSVQRIVDTLNVSTNVARRVRGLVDGNIDPESSEAVQCWVRRCYHKPRKAELIMCAIDEALGTFGVEPIEGKWVDNYYQNINAVHCNSGDTYVPTIVFCHKRQRFMLTSMGSYVEHG